MDIYLIRHGIAALRGTYSEDGDRPLVEEGRTKTTLVAKRLHSIGVKFDLVLTSPLLRAKQTAEILISNKLSDKLEICHALAPDGDLEDWLNWYQQHQPSSVALVGHQPDLGDWTKILVTGNNQGEILVKKSAVIGLKLSSYEVVKGHCQLFLLTSPKWLG